MNQILTNPKFFPQEDSHFMLNGPAGLLEVMTTLPKHDKNKGIGIICHPHPLQEGAMTNKVVHTTYKAFDRQGLKTIRFNFRGVGQSQGSFADTVGETDDLLAVINWVKKVLKPDNIWLAGFSFGAFIAAKGAEKNKITQLITIAPGISTYSFDKLNQLSAPWLMILADKDEIVDTDTAKTWAQNQTKNQINLQTISQASHFFHGKLIELRELIEENMIVPE